MIDFIKGFSVQSEQDNRTGKWSVQCPACSAVIRAMTDDGINTALCAHMNERHFFPARGNA